MDNKNSLILEFRNKVIKAMISAGVKPPLPDSPEEQKLFNDWLIGRKKLKQWQ